jgi:FtsP/CotA-like multicopper oxidase with cupredoxin domain
MSSAVDIEPTLTVAPGAARKSILEPGKRHPSAAVIFPLYWPARVLASIPMTRRDLLAATCGVACSAVTAFAQHRQEVPRGASPTDFTGEADVTLRIGEMSLDLGLRRSVRTIAYNGQVPGPALRTKVGRPLTVDVWNDTKEEDIVHWHGFHIPPEVDGVYDAGTPGVPPNGGRQRYVFTPQPAGTHWYHSHNSAGRNLKRSTYTGQFGLFILDDGSDAGTYDLDVPLLFHEWEPRLTSGGATDVEFRYFSINGKMLGGGEPIRVREGQRVLFRLVNASATLTHRIALPRHQFLVHALDGHPVPRPRAVPVVEIAPGERVDASVDMNHPGVWICGSVYADWRRAGMGIVVEYAGHGGPPRWEAPQAPVWNYILFGSADAVPEPSSHRSLVFRPSSDGHHWTINSKSHPHGDPLVVQAGRRHRWVLDNQSAEHHPMHLHRHRFEIVRFAGTPVSGLWKDVVIVPAWKQVEIDVLANQPGRSLFHCHQQFHMDMGFMTMMQYAP